MADDGRGTLYGHSIPNGPVVPDAEEVARVKARDARIKAYRARERAKVVAAFDRFLERMWNDPYGERPEWADPPVWLRTEAERTAVPIYWCSLCPFTTDVPGLVDAHYKEEHRDPVGSHAPTGPVGIHQKAGYDVARHVFVNTPGVINCTQADDDGHWCNRDISDPIHGGDYPRDAVAYDGHGGTITPHYVPIEVEHPCSRGRCTDPAAHAEGAHDL